MSKQRVTMAQIATRAGVHITTVSQALRGNTRLSKETRERINSLAIEMGYTPDPALSALIAYRGATQAPAYQSTIAWFNHYPERKTLRGIHSFRDYLLGAERRAEELGYKLEEFWPLEPGLSPAALGRNLIARGVRGIMVFPLHTPTGLPDFPWQHFSALSMGYSLLSPRLHRVGNHQFNTAMHLLRALRQLGYRRIGFFLPEEFDQRVNRGPSTAYFSYDRQLPPEEKVPPLRQLNFSNDTGLAEWIQQHRPEVIVTQDLRLRDWMLSRRYRVPEEIGLAYFNVEPQEKLLSGMNQNDLEIGRVALDFIVAIMHRNERGIPSVAQNVLLDGEWMPRHTTRQVGPPAPWPLDNPASQITVTKQDGCRP